MKKFAFTVIAAVLCILVMTAPLPAYASDGAPQILSVTCGDVRTYQYTGGEFRGEGDGRYYAYDLIPDDITVTFADGEVIEGDAVTVRAALREKYGTDATVSVSTVQDADNELGSGAHEISGSFLGHPFSWTVYIDESPVKSCRADRVTYIEDTNGYYRYDGGEEYYSYRLTPGLAELTYSDGSVRVTDLETVSDDDIYIFPREEQTADSPWKCGIHVCDMYIYGFKTTIEFEITESPVKEISVTDVMQYYGFDTYYNYFFGTWEYSVSDVIPEYVVVLKDGTRLYSDAEGNVTYKGVTYYYTCPLYYSRTGFETGYDYTEPFSVMGYEGQMTLHTRLNPYVGLEIEQNGGTLLLSLTDRNGETFTASAEAAACSADRQPDGTVTASIIFEDQAGEMKTMRCLINGGGEYLDRDIGIRAGDLVSNTLEECTFFRMTDIAVRFGEQLRQLNLDGYDIGGEIPQAPEDLTDEVLILSAGICGIPSETVRDEDGNTVLLYQADEIQNAVSYVLHEKTDISAAPQYDAQTGNVYCEYRDPGTVFFTKEPETWITPAGSRYTLRADDGEYIYTAVFGNNFAPQKVSVLMWDYKGHDFTDVDAAAYYAIPVEWAWMNGITAGTTATTFSPASPCTRAQVVTFLYRAAGSPTVRTDRNPFKDVEKGSWYYDAVLWATGEGITNGMTDTTFGPDEKCTRAHVVTFLGRTMRAGKADSTFPFDDVPGGTWYSDYVAWATGKGITNGTSERTFSPSQVCTRGQIVTFLFRAYF